MTAAEPVWRLIVDGRADGAWNMAVDEALLEAAAEGESPTLRLYGFRPAALSLGRSQPAACVHEPAALRAAGIDLVRRPTGGLAVLHEHERTYSVVGSLERSPFGAGVVATYRAIGSALERALRALGVAAVARNRGRAPDPRGSEAGPACFAAATAHEIVVGGRKLVGSAQLRRRRAFLQHGSILVRADPERLARALGAPVPATFTDLVRELGRDVADEVIDAALAEAFAASFGARLERGSLRQSESRAAARLREEKYRSPTWTLDGRAPTRVAG